MTIRIKIVQNSILNIVCKIKGEEPFDAYLKLGYRQVDRYKNKHEQPTPKRREPSDCLFSL
jgi:hypothetical protein